MSRLAPLRVVHNDLGQPLRELASDGSGRGAYVVWWLDDVALGHSQVPAEQLPVSPRQLAVLAAHAVAPAVGDRLFEGGFELPMPMQNQPAPKPPPDFARLAATTEPLAELRERRAGAPEPTGPTMSVLVCTLDRPRALRRCLASLALSTAAPEEIVVVDNAPDRPGTRAVVEEFPGTTYVAEPRRGLSVARNTAVAHSKGEVVAFTDDDAVVHPCWLTSLQACFDRPEVMAVTGLVLPSELDTEAQVAFERVLGGFNRGYQALTYGREFFADGQSRSVPVWRIGAGANMAIRREALESVGGFDERLGAGAAGCSEDSELWYRLLAAGWECGYTPDAVVFHFHRDDMAGVHDQAYQYMKGHTAALWVQFARYRHWGNVRRALLHLPWWFLTSAVKEVPFRPPAERRMFLAGLSGWVAGLGALPAALRSGPPSAAEVAGG